jgi:hypothetical protein
MRKKSIPKYQARVGDGFLTCIEPPALRRPIDWQPYAFALTIAVLFALALRFGLPLAMIILSALGEG